MNAVGIDVSKGKSMVAALRPMGEVALLPQEFLHTEVGLEQMAYAIIALGEDTRVIMEATGRYHEPVAAALHEYGIYVCVLNPLFIKQSGGGSIRKVKTDKADAMKIAKYGLDNWVDLREYTPMDTVRQQLKLCSRQYNLYMKTVVSLQNNLISLTDKTFPGVNELFSSPERADGHQKWVDFVMTFYHCDCICRVSENAFAERYQKWCKRKGYHFSAEKAQDVYLGSCGHFTTLPKNDNTKLLITTAAQQLLAGKMTLAALRTEMTRLAKQLPEYDIVRAMYGVGETTAVQLIELPEGYEAHVVPRSSTFKNYGLLQANSMGVVDYTYRGDNDQWRVPMYATRDVHIDKNTRISQFRIMKNQPPLAFTRVEHLTGPDRGGFGSTGK